MAASKETLDLMARRDRINKRFMLYSHPDRIEGNYAALADLALIGGRLDTMIRRNLEADRKAAKRET